MTDRDEKVDDDARDDDARDEEQEQPGPERSADETTQQDAGLDGGTAGADRGERVGDDDR